MKKIYVALHKIEPSAQGLAQGHCYMEVLLLEFSLSPCSFQGCRLVIGCHGSEGIGGSGSTRFLTGVLGLDSVTHFWIFVETTTWSGRPAGGGVCCPKFFATAKQASRYVGRLNSV